MANLTDHQSTALMKGMLIGASGTAKSGSLASLAILGYHLHILDFDNGLDVLVDLLAKHPEALARVDYESIANPVKMKNSRPVPENGKGFTKALGLIEKWSDGTIPSEWGPQHILVLDSLTMFSRLAMEHTMALRGRLGQRPEQSDWGNAQEDVENVLAQLYSNNLNTNVLVCAHIAYQDDPDGRTVQLPVALGKALGPKIPRYFNTLLGYSLRGGKRIISTVPTSSLALKSPRPNKVKDLYMLDIKDPRSGLGDYFRDAGYYKAAFPDGP